MEPSTSPPDGVWVRLAAEAMWVILAMAGGIARYLDTYLRTGRSPQIGQLVAHAMVSGFSGYMVAQLVLRISPDWTLVAAGIGGYLGTQGLDWAAEYLRGRFMAPPCPPPPRDTRHHECDCKECKECTDE